MELASEFTSWLIAVLSTETAQKVYFSAGLGAASLVSLYTGIRRLIYLQNIDPAETFRIRRRGPSTTRKQTIDRHKAENRANLAKRLQTLIVEVAIVVCLGIVVPTAAFVALIVYSGWLFGTEAVLLNAYGDGIPVPPWPELTIFVLDQLFRGGLNDLAEVFRIGFSPLTNNPTNYPFSLAVFAYRLACDIFVLALVFFSVRAWWAWRSATERLG